MRSGSHIGNSWRSSGCSTRSAPSCGGQLGPGGCRLDRQPPSMPRATSAAIVERADRAGADDEGAVAVDQSRPGDAVQRHRQRLGQRRLPHREAVGQGAPASARRGGCTPAKAPWCSSSAMSPRRFSHWDGRPSRQRRHRPHFGDGPPTTWSPTVQPVDVRSRPRRSCRSTRGRRRSRACPIPPPSCGGRSRTRRSGSPRRAPGPGPGRGPSGPRPRRRPRPGRRPPASRRAAPASAVMTRPRVAPNTERRISSRSRVPAVR